LAGRRDFGGMDTWNLNLSVTRSCRLKVSGPWEEIIFAKGISNWGRGHKVCPFFSLFSGMNLTNEKNQGKSQSG